MALPKDTEEPLALADVEPVPRLHHMLSLAEHSISFATAFVTIKPDAWYWQQTRPGAARAIWTIMLTENSRSCPSRIECSRSAMMAMVIGSPKPKPAV